MKCVCDNFVTDDLKGTFTKQYIMNSVCDGFVTEFQYMIAL